MLIQSLWDLKLSWDEPLPENLKNNWYQLQDELPHLNAISISRHVVLKNAIIIELHGFADASERAYGACIYVRSIDCHVNVAVHLLISKSKVAPLKKLTLPRLELCGALLLGQLARKVSKSMPNLKVTNHYYWTDSTITLNWIKASPNRWKTFVANRVAQIQENTEVDSWYHVSTLHNPADLISRGVSPIILIKSTLWWHGPEFLSKSSLSLSAPERLIELPEQRTAIMHCMTTYAKNTIELFNRVSSYSKLIRIVGFILRWRSKTFDKGKSASSVGLSLEELNRAKLALIRVAQCESFSDDINSLKSQNLVKSTSHLASLHPFLDENNLLRVGGRLHNSTLPYRTKHQLLLCSKHPFTEMIARYEHIRQLHCGPQSLLYALRQEFWPLSGRNLTRRVDHACITCFKVKPSQNSAPIMGSLPADRVEQQFVFNKVGVDYAGPFLLKSHSLRNAKIVKCYVAVFVCMVTKAIHLELVSELTTSAFIATLRRFVARRGAPHSIFSDNGTNFVGANRELSELHAFLRSNALQSHIIDTFSVENIRWRFIPASSPSFGGLWEAGVKSVKHHLRRVLGIIKTTFEHFYTILVQVEAVLNSRPISPLSADHTDLQPLTPGHFLIGRPLMEIPTENHLQQPINRLKLHQQLQQIVQHFWARYYKEYINNLQTRQKWKQTKGSSALINQLVLIKDDNLPPLRWKMGRITSLN